MLGNISLGFSTFPSSPLLSDNNQIERVFITIKTLSIQFIKKQTVQCNHNAIGISTHPVVIHTNIPFSCETTEILVSHNPCSTVSSINVLSERANITLIAGQCSIHKHLIFSSVCAEFRVSGNLCETSRTEEISTETVQMTILSLPAEISKQLVIPVERNSQIIISGCQCEISNEVVISIKTVQMTILSLSAEISKQLVFPVERNSQIFISGCQCSVHQFIAIKVFANETKVSSYIPTIFKQQLPPSIHHYIDYIKQNVRSPIYKVELLRKTDETPFQSIEGHIISDSGSLNISNQEGVRRTCSFNISNYDGQYISLIENLSIGSKFKLWLGDCINGQNIYFPQGVFVFDDPAILSQLADKQVQFSGSDKWSMLNGQNGGILNGTYTIPKDSSIGKVIRDTLNLDIVSDSIRPLISDSLEHLVTTYDITKNAGDCVADIFLEIALNIDANIYYNANGQLVVEANTSSIYEGVTYHFSEMEYNYLGGTRQYKLSEIKNAVLVIGDNMQDADVPIIYEAINNDLSDPNSVPRLNRKVVHVVTDYVKGINTMEKAQMRANYELRKLKIKFSSLSINCAALYFLDVNKIIALSDQYLNASNEKFILNNINFPIGTDLTATLDVIKTVEV